MQDHLNFLRLLLVLLVMSLALVASILFLEHIPLIGKLPGDLEIDFPGVSLYVPITTTVLLGILLTFITFFVHRNSKK